jgi:hypothetical protein
MSRSIRRLTVEERDRNDEQHQARYDDLYDQVDAQMVAENIADGGACDYRPDGAQVHARVEKMMRE